MKRVLLLLVLALILPLTALSQEATPEATPEATAELPFSEVLASLPSGRGPDGAFLLGDPDAPRTLIEFADWACPHCIDYKPVIEQFIRTYVVSGEANFEFRIFPTAGGARTVIAGEVAECADAQRPGAFWEAYTVLYDLAEQRQYDALQEALTTALDLDSEALATCLQTAGQVETDTRYGIEHGVQGTPIVLVREGDGDPIPVRLDVAGTSRTFNAPSIEQLAEMMALPFADMIDPQIALNEQFLTENAAREGVVTTESGLQYRVDTEGSGTVAPGDSDEVTLHYVGAFIDGPVFDSSRERGEPVSFSLTQVIPGFAEAIQQMQVGDVITVWVPPALAYGSAGVGPIPPNSILVFEIELLAINGEPAS